MAGFLANGLRVCFLPAGDDAVHPFRRGERSPPFDWRILQLFPLYPGGGITERLACEEFSGACGPLGELRLDRTFATDSAAIRVRTRSTTNRTSR